MKLPLPTFLCLFLFMGCSPKSYTYLNLLPVEHQETTNPSKPVVQLKSENLSFKCTFLNANEFDLIFNVEFANTSNQMVAINPKQFYYNALEENGDPMFSDRAFDADDLVFELSENIRQNKKANREANIVGWVFFGLNVISAAVAFSNDNEELGLSYSADATIDASLNLIQSSVAKKHIVQLEAERDFYAYSALRDTVLNPGQFIEGLVIFPRYDPAYQLEVVYPIEKENFKILYDQFYETVDLEQK